MLVTYLKPQWPRVALLGQLLIGSIGLQLLNPQVLRRFIDSATHAASDRTLASAAGLFLLIAVTQQILSVTATYFSENIGWNATNALRADLLLHCLRLDASFHKTRTPGELIDRIDGDVTTLAGFFSQLVVQVLGNLLLLIGVLVVLWSIDWRIGLSMVAFTAVVFLSLRQIQKLVAPLWKVARQRSAELYGFIEERLTGTEDIRSSGAALWTMRRLYERMAEQLRAERRARLTGRLVWIVSDIMFTVGIAAIFLLAARLYHGGGLTIGTIYVVFFYMELLFQPLTQITRQAEDFQKASAGIMRVQELLGTCSALKDTGTLMLPAGPLSVSLSDVVFSYSAEDEPVIRGLNVRLEAGRVLGILGRTGSGKTTLTRLLFRLYDIQRGVIALGGIDIRDTSLAELRRRVGIVTQEVQLFNATIRDNLTLFDTSIADDRIMAALESMGLGSWLERFPDGLETVLAAGSGGLSAGEGQLLAFTRILLRDPGLVILDEASSRLDPATEQLIERCVDRLFVGRTGIVIAHRLHTVMRADEILVLEDGELAEYGEREALVRNTGSRFARLLKHGMEDVLA